MASILSKSVLMQLCPQPSNVAKRKIWDGYVSALTSEDGAALFEQFGVTTKQRMAMFLSQVCLESGGFTLIFESGAYSSGRIMEIFGVGHHSAAVTASEAKSLAGNGYALFERVYGLGNPNCCGHVKSCQKPKYSCKARELGNWERGDGFRCRGQGLLQNTGRGALETYSSKIGCSIEELTVPLNSLQAALLEWKEKNCNPAADADDVVLVTKKINGGRNGLADRRQYLARAKKLLENAPEIKSKSVVDRKPDVSIGDDGHDVKRLQELLTRAGYPLELDGTAGKKTEGQVAAFQVNHGLPGTGIADEETWKLLETVEPTKPKVVVVKDLKDQGSHTIWYTQLGKRVLKWLGFGALASGTDTVANDGSTLTTTLDALDTAKMTVSRVTETFGWGISWPGVLIVLAVIAGVAVWWLLDRIEKRRLEREQTS